MRSGRQRLARPLSPPSERTTNSSSASCSYFWVLGSVVHLL
ncbi:hypothetical protein CHGG_01906 [Chaetomium globosum CBS 148.51]|uniref:Uncharacterized protein n=1 Tax=Chaetomium globosum (strain ATCC 6205 / CBS 148.51 / DSM 1962 / NBRC 6347 / NRRL 1970) TaxID=306901 RepID=Q2HCZ8_CHAGB|nr:uncharacterized protein CHGG_01906 [Chaetomium globosum CBS 148.51]EAQ93671.1 hypothetical protein CHGG_01906 [Chaetomium globosum CBS 148.51]